MVLWRISNYADLGGAGGLYASAQWHTAGQPVVYLAENPASALLEVLVHLETDEDHRPDSYQLLKIETDDRLPFEAVEFASLSPEWLTNEFETQSHGDEWLAGRRTPLLRVPSAITPETWNWLLNPRHPEAEKIRSCRPSRIYSTLGSSAVKTAAENVRERGRFIKFSRTAVLSSISTDSPLPVDCNR